MESRKRLLTGALVLSMLSVTAVHARGGWHGHPGGWGPGGAGFYLGGPFWPNWPYPYYYPPVVPVPTEPPVYIERSDDAEADQAEDQPRRSDFWYYCADPPGYYPSVTDCPVGWQQVAPR